MLSPQESSIEVKKYLKKLLNIIENDVVFSFFKTRIVDKKKVDDIMCCIEASFPEKYKALIKKNGVKSLKSYHYYQQASKAIKNKFLLSSSVYKADYAEVTSLISATIRSLDSDINFVYKDQSGMF